MLAATFSPRSLQEAGAEQISMAADAGAAFAVRMQSGADTNARAAALARELGGQYWNPAPDVSQWVAFTASAGQRPDEFYRRLKQDVRVEAVVPIQSVSIATVPNLLLPDDASFGSLYGMQNTGQNGGIVDADIDAPEGWNLFTGSTAVTIADIDTGVDYEHIDLYKNIWINPGEI
ncbi:MAG: hypothetical protein ACR2K1_13730, partial [Saprospiraceae bacterium]